MEVRRGDGSVIAFEVVGEPGATPLLFCHGLADSRLSARLFTQAARELRLRVVAPDRPGVGGTDPRRLRRLVDWVEDAELVLDALRFKPHPAHFCLKEALAVIEKVRPQRAYLTHMAHEMDHETVNRQLPPHVQLAYDGLQFDF